MYEPTKEEVREDVRMRIQTSYGGLHMKTAQTLGERMVILEFDGSPLILNEFESQVFPDVVKHLGMLECLEKIEYTQVVSLKSDRVRNNLYIL